MHKSVMLVFLGLSGLVSIVAGAADYSLSEVVERSMRQSSAIRAAKLNIEALRQKVILSGKLPNPEIEISLGRGNQTRWQNEIEFSQAFPLGSRLKAQKAVARVDVLGAILELSVFEQEFAQSVKNAALAYLAAQEQLRLAKERFDSHQALLTEIQKKANAGEVKAEHAIEAEHHAAEAEEELQLAELSTETAHLALMTFANDPSLNFVGNLGQEVAHLDHPVIGDGSLTLKLHALAVDRAQAEKFLAEHARWGDIEVGAFFEKEESRIRGEEAETLAGLKLSLPLPLWNDGSREIIEKTRLVQKAQAEWELRKSEAKLELRTALAEKKAQAQICRRRREKMLPLAIAAEKIAREEYFSGEVSADHLFRHIEERFAVQSDLIECQLEYGKILTRIERIAAK